jgi:hypothetical protein
MRTFILALLFVVTAWAADTETPLFNGKDLDGWTVVGGEGHSRAAKLSITSVVQLATYDVRSPCAKTSGCGRWRIYRFGEPTTGAAKRMRVEPN